MRLRLSGETQDKTSGGKEREFGRQFFKVAFFTRRFALFGPIRSQAAGLTRLQSF